MATLKEAIKTAARISNDRHDEEILAYIATARDELKRVGVHADALSISANDAMSTGTTTFTEYAVPLVQHAIITYCLWQLTEEPDLIDKYEQAFRLQADALRRRFPAGGE